MAARLIVDREAGTPPPIPNRDDDRESFWHVLLWVTLQNCDHRMGLMKIVHLLGSLFDCMYVGDTGQMAGGEAKRDSLETRSCIKNTKLRSNILHEILENTAEPLATRYSSDKDLNDIFEMQRMWEKVESENPTLDEDHRIIELVLRIAQTRKPLFTRAHPYWMKWRTMQSGGKRYLKMLSMIPQSIGIQGVIISNVHCRVPQHPERRNEKVIRTSMKGK